MHCSWCSAVPGARWVLPSPVPTVLSRTQHWCLPGHRPQTAFRGGGLTPATPLMGKLRHEEVKADISKHKMLQALFSVIPRGCRSWGWSGGIRGPQCSPKVGLEASKPGSQIHSQGGTLGQNILLRDAQCAKSPGRAEPLGTHLWALMELNP